MRGIAQNKLRESRRRGRVEDRARRKLALEPEALEDADLVRVDELASGRGVLALVDELPDRQRAAVRARIVDEREYADIAAELRCSEMVVRQQVSRGLSRLKRRLAGGRTMSDYFDRIERQLVARVEAVRLGRARARTRWSVATTGSPVGLLVPLVAAAVVIAVAAVFLTTGTRRRPSPSPSASGSTITFTASPATAHTALEPAIRESVTVLRGRLARGVCAAASGPGRRPGRRHRHVAGNGGPGCSSSLPPGC